MQYLSHTSVRDTDELSHKIILIFLMSLASVKQLFSMVCITVVWKKFTNKNFVCALARIKIKHIEYFTSV